MKQTKKTAAPSKRVEISKKKKANRTRARGISVSLDIKQPKEKPKAPKPPKEPKEQRSKESAPPQEFTEADYLTAIRLKYPPEVVIAKLDRILEAKRAYTTGSGKVVEHEDAATQIKGLDMLLNRVVGKPLEQPEVSKSAKSTSFADLKERAKKSAPFRESLIEMLQELTQS